MLTISKPLSAGQAQSYHQTEFTAEEQCYRSQHGVTVGGWQGRLATNGTIASEDHKFSVPVQRQDLTGTDRSWASRGLPRSLPQRKLLMTTHLFDNECDRSDLEVPCAVQHELVATVDHNANGISELEIAALASSRQPQTGCPVTARAALHNMSPVRANEVF